MIRVKGETDEAWAIRNLRSLAVELKHAHHTDLVIRINGEDRHYEADWLRYLVPETAADQPRKETSE